MSRISAQLSVYPDYLHDKMGLDFSWKYHNDPVYRNRMWKEVLRWMNGKFGQYGSGLSDPPDSYSATTLGSVHLVCYLFGDNVLYFENQFPDTHGYVLENLADLKDFSIRHPVFMERLENLENNLDHLINQFGRDKVAAPFYSGNTDGVQDLENTHCPLTIAYKLFGNRLMTEMFTSPGDARYMLRQSMEISRFLSDRLRGKLDIPKPERVLMSACSSTFLGPDQWEEFVMPLIAEFCEERETFFHSCGLSNHLLDSFGKLAASTPVIRFDCREQSGIDITAATEKMPDAMISLMMDVPKCLTRTSAEMKEAVRKAVEAAGDNVINLILMLPEGTHDEIVEAFFEQAVYSGAQLEAESGFRFV